VPAGASDAEVPVSADPGCGCQSAGGPAVPDVGAALALLAGAGIPVTAHGAAPAFVVVCAHLPPGDAGSTLDWDALARLGGTLVLLGVDRLPQVCEALARLGRDAGAPVAVLSQGAAPVTTTLAWAAHDAAHVRAPAVVVVGEVVARRA
jgi:siroheme synthase